MRAKPENHRKSTCCKLTACCLAAPNTWLPNQKTPQTWPRVGLGDLWAAIIAVVSIDIYSLYVKTDLWPGYQCMISTLQRQDLPTLRPWPSVGKCMLLSGPPAATVPWCDNEAVPADPSWCFNTTCSMVSSIGFYIWCFPYLHNSAAKGRFATLITTGTPYHHWFFPSKWAT